MADDLKFTHISVTSDEDEDVVIQAGAPSAAPATSGVSSPAVKQVTEPQAAVTPEARATPVTEMPVASKPASAAAPQPAPKPASAAASKTAKKKDGYHETTLEDIESVKMSGTQKAVIAVAVLAIIAFVVYYVFTFAI